MKEMALSWMMEVSQYFVVDVDDCKMIISAWEVYFDENLHGTIEDELMLS